MRAIDADHLRELIDELIKSKGVNPHLLTLKMCLNSCPTIPAGITVTCGNCKFNESKGTGHAKCMYSRVALKDTDYCSFGEKG